MITITVDAPSIIVVDMSDHPAMRGIVVNGSLVLNSWISRCSGIVVNGTAIEECSDYGVPKEILVDLTVPMACKPDTCSVEIVVKEGIHGTLTIDALENSVFMPFMECKHGR